MHEHAQGSAVDHQPGNEGTELRECEEVNFEHGHGVGANRAVVQAVGAEIGD